MRLLLHDLLKLLSLGLTQRPEVWHQVTPALTPVIPGDITWSVVRLPQTLKIHFAICHLVLVSLERVLSTKGNTNAVASINYLPDTRCYFQDEIISRLSLITQSD